MAMLRGGKKWPNEALLAGVSWGRRNTANWDLGLRSHEKGSALRQRCATLLRSSPVPVSKVH